MYTPPWLRDRTRFWSYSDTGSVDIGSRVVFGYSKPPDQYSFAFVPRNTEVLGLVDPIPTPSSNVLDIPLLRSLCRIFASPDSTPKLSSSFNLVKGMVALLQLIYASSTLYRTSGGQVKQYGFAAPGLTVLPYAVMSALNLVANLLTPQYPTMYLVRSEVMEEAERRTGLSFHYVVGKIVDKSGTDNVVKKGWSEIAGSFKDDDKQLYVPSSEEEDEKIAICDDSDQTIYIPACPRFPRTDDNRSSPLRHFIESSLPRRQLEFPLYQFLARPQQAPIQISIFSHSHTIRLFLKSLESRLTAQYEHIPQSEIQPSKLRRFASTLIGRLTRLIERLYDNLNDSLTVITDHLILITGRKPSRQPDHRPDHRWSRLGECEILLVGSTVCAEALFALALSNFSGQQSTLAQRAWTVTWFLVSSTYGTGIVEAPVDGYGEEMTLIRRLWECFVIVACGAPAIGGFVVVSQMLEAYGICYKFV